MPVIPRWMRSSCTRMHRPPERSSDSFACPSTMFHVLSPRLFRLPSRAKSCSTRRSASSGSCARAGRAWPLPGSPMRPAELRSGDTCQAMSVVLIRLPRRSLRRNTWRRPLRSEARRSASPWRTRMRFSSASGMRSASVPSVTRSSRAKPGPAAPAPARAPGRRTFLRGVDLREQRAPHSGRSRDDCWILRRLLPAQLGQELGEKRRRCRKAEAPLRAECSLQQPRLRSPHPGRAPRRPR